MITGPQNMPNFPNATLDQKSKQDIIKYIDHLQTATAPGGLELGEGGGQPLVVHVGDGDLRPFARERE